MENVLAGYSVSVLMRLGCAAETSPVMRIIGWYHKLSKLDWLVNICSQRWQEITGEAVAAAFLLEPIITEPLKVGFCTKEDHVCFGMICEANVYGEWRSDYIQLKAMFSWLWVKIKKKEDLEKSEKQSQLVSGIDRENGNFQDMCLM